MKNLLVATAVIALIAPSVTLAGSFPSDFPTVSGEFFGKSEQIVQPITKLAISTDSEIVATPTKSDAQK